MIDICKHDECTGCAACRDICPKQCITMVTDDLDALHPRINQDRCVDCKLCQKTCPNNRDIDFASTQKVWAAWSKDDKVRLSSASGGIACELYRYWLAKGGVATGVVFERDKGCHFILIEDEKVLTDVQNSKYTFSNTDGIYKKVKEKLLLDIPVLFIGVPCQVAGLYGFLKKEYSNLTTVDIICHGMPPAAYLDQHIKCIEKKKKEQEQTSRLFFRDPKYYTYTYTFTLYNIAAKQPFYKKKVLNTDNYQLGYHRSLIYRENCYHCHYARKERVGDLTLGDFSGLGKLAPFEHSKYNVSCVLQNTEKGAILINSISDKIYKEERPRDEAFLYENQLKKPSVKHISRTIFEEKYKKTNDFEKASNVALKQEKTKALRTKYIEDIKTFIRSLLPKRIILFLRNAFNK